MANSITPPPHLLKKFSTEARDESNKRNGTGYLKTFAKLCIEWANSKSTFSLSQIRSSEIQPPPELVQQWMNEICDDPDGDPHFVSSDDRALATRAAQWGADQELEACCEWADETGWQGAGDGLRTARRSKPPSLKEAALKILSQDEWSREEEGIIRRALEALPND
jgi:hypothetical protein